MTKNTRRNRRRQHLESEFRRLHRIQDRLGEIWERSRREKPVLVPLPEPIFAGWERYFFVRPDVVRSPEGSKLDRVLNVVQRVEVSNRKDFATRSLSRGGKLKPRPHHLRSLDDRGYDKLPEELKKYFIYTHERHRDYWTKKWEWRRYWSVRHPWKFVSRVRPYYRTHTELINNQRKAEEKYLDDKLYRYGNGKDYPYRHILRHIRSHHDSWYGPPPEFVGEEELREYSKTLEWGD